MLRRLVLVCAGLSVFYVPPVRAASRWVKVTGPDFELYTTAGEKQGAETLRFFEQVREFFRLAAPIEGDRTSVLRIVQFEDPAEYERFRPNPSAIAFFASTAEREYVVLGDRAMKDTHAAIHEYFHVVVRRSGLKLPLWLNEGWADVFSSLRPKGKEVAVGDLLPDRVKALEKEKWLDFDTLTSADKASPYYHEESRVGMFYAESWALAHMLFLAPEYKDHFSKFVMALHGGKSAADACQSAFGKSSAQVFADLHSYLDRKQLFGTIFSIPPERQQWQIASASVTDFDARLMKADLLVAAAKGEQAKTEYESLAREQPKNLEVLRVLGNMALREKNSDVARQYFRRAYDAGEKDAHTCYELARLDRDAGAEIGTLVPPLERALQSQPDFPAAEAMLGSLRVQTRDFSGGLAMLSGLRSVSEEDAWSVYCGLALAQIEMGDVTDAQQNMASCQRRSRTPAEIQRSQRLGRFIQARSLPVTAVHLGEKVTTVTGLLQGVQCSPQVNRIVVSVADKTALFDLPPEDAIEMPTNPVEKVQFQCGQMRPIRIVVEFAPPRTAMETSAGVVRRLIF